MNDFIWEIVSNAHHESLANILTLEMPSFDSYSMSRTIDLLKTSMTRGDFPALQELVIRTPRHLKGRAGAYISEADFGTILESRGVSYRLLEQK
jgi:hypothetical protein